MSSMENKKIQVEISMNTVFKVIVILAILAFLYFIRDVVAIVFFSVLLVLLLEPPVSWLYEKKVPRPLAVLVIYSLVISVFALAVIMVIPPIAAESQQIVNVLGNYSEIITRYTGIQVQNDLSATFNNFEQYLPQATRNIFSQLTSFISGFVALLIVFVIAFYGLVEDSAFKRVIRSFVPSSYQPYLYSIANRIQRKLGLWLRGQLLLGLVIFVLTYFGLLLLDVEYALVLALSAGILEFIPYVGPIIAGFLAVLLTVFISPFTALMVIVLFMVIQQIENHILVPKIMQRTTGLNPVISIIALLIGGKLGGVVGLLLAIPVTLTLSVFLQDILGKKFDDQLELEE